MKFLRDRQHCVKRIVRYLGWSVHIPLCLWQGHRGRGVRTCVAMRGLRGQRILSVVRLVDVTVTSAPRRGRGPQIRRADAGPTRLSPNYIHMRSKYRNCNCTEISSQMVEAGRERRSKRNRAPSGGIEPRNFQGDVHEGKSFRDLGSGGAELGCSLTCRKFCPASLRKFESDS